MRKIKPRNSTESQAAHCGRALKNEISRRFLRLLGIIIALAQWTLFVRKPSVHKRSLVSKTRPLSPIVSTIKVLSTPHRHFRSVYIDEFPQSTGLSPFKVLIVTFYTLSHSLESSTRHVHAPPAAPRSFF